MREVHQYDMEGNYIQTFNKLSCIKGVLPQIIFNVCNGWSKSAYGFRYSYNKTDKLIPIWSYKVKQFKKENMNVVQLKTENIAKNITDVVKQYKKANKLRKTQILKKYGVLSIDKLTSLLDTSKKDKKVTMTELASLVLNSPNTTIEVSFQKQVKEKDVYLQIMEMYQKSTPLDFSTNLQKVIKTAYNGQERVATGFHNNKTDKLAGRLYFTETTVEKDLEANSDNRMILISLNHLNWALIDGIKYTVK